MSVFREAVARLVPLGSGPAGAGPGAAAVHLYPLWRLILPAAVLFTSNALLRALFHHAVLRRLRRALASPRLHLFLLLIVYLYAAYVLLNCTFVSSFVSNFRQKFIHHLNFLLNFTCLNEQDA